MEVGTEARGGVPCTEGAALQRGCTAAPGSLLPLHSDKRLEPAGDGGDIESNQQGGRGAPHLLRVKIM